MAFGSTLVETEARPPEYWEGRVRSGATGTENVLFVAEDADEWIGILAGFVNDSASAPHVDLVSMWVAPTYRRQGVGRRLIESLVVWTKQRGAEQIALWVTENNTQAIALYRHLGFTDTGETQPLPSDPRLLERQMALLLGPQ